MDSRVRENHKCDALPSRTSTNFAGIIAQETTETPRKSRERTTHPK